MPLSLFEESRKCVCRQSCQSRSTTSTTTTATGKTTIDPAVLNRALPTLQVPILIAGAPSLSSLSVIEQKALTIKIAAAIAKFSGLFVMRVGLGSPGDDSPPIVPTVDLSALAAELELAAAATAATTPAARTAAAASGWTVEKLEATNDRADATSCYIAIFEGDKCVSAGGVYKIEATWYQTHFGGTFGPVPGLNSCGRVVENWVGRSAPHGSYVGLLGQDIAENGQTFATFDGELNCGGTAALDWTEDTLEATNDRADATSCYIAIFEGDKCVSAGGVYKIEATWYQTHFGGTFGPVPGLNSCGRVVENWVGRSAPHGSYVGLLGQDIAENGQTFATFDGELNCGSARLRLRLRRQAVVPTAIATVFLRRTTTAAQIRAATALLNARISDGSFTFVVNIDGAPVVAAAANIGAAGDGPGKNLGFRAGEMVAFALASTEADFTSCDLAGLGGLRHMSFAQNDTYVIAEVRAGCFRTTAFDSLWAPLNAIRAVSENAILDDQGDGYEGCYPPFFLSGVPPFFFFLTFNFFR